MWNGKYKTVENEKYVKERVTVSRGGGERVVEWKI